MNQVHKSYPKGRLLVVDDEATIRAGLERVLQLEGYEVATASSCLEAKMLLLGNAVDLLLLDLNLEDENGWDSYKRLIDLGPLLPIIVITARPDQAQPALAGGVMLMEKPLDLPRLLRMISSHLATKSANEPGAEMSTPEPVSVVMSQEQQFVEASK